MGTFGNRCALDGKTPSRDHTAALVATNALASLAAAHLRARRFVEASRNTPVPAGQPRYYDGVLYRLGLLHRSGEFNVWPPR
jgi:oligosaccharide reducing-end xylanase